MSVSYSRRLRAAVAAAAMITTATAAVVANTSAANADTASAVPARFDQPREQLKALDFEALSTAGWSGAADAASAEPAASTEPAEVAPE
ncbi:hypothetical protein I0Q12_08285, partial [Rhodococcus sp. CX]|nr:hypothetical protein [Rhodococcus sp. CX]